MHAYASEDPVFVAMNKRGQREAQLGTFCINCHAPMAVKLGLSDGTNYDPSTLPPEAKGITCYFCHNVDKVTDDHNNGLVLAMDQTMRGGASKPADTPAHDSLERQEPHGLRDQRLDDVRLVPRHHHARTLERSHRALVRGVEDHGVQPTRHQRRLTCSTCHMIGRRRRDRGRTGLNVGNRARWLSRSHVPRGRSGDVAVPEHRRTDSPASPTSRRRDHDHRPDTRAWSARRRVASVSIRTGHADGSHRYVQRRPHVSERRVARSPGLDRGHRVRRARTPSVFSSGKVGDTQDPEDLPSDHELNCDDTPHAANKQCSGSGIG